GIPVPDVRTGTAQLEVPLAGGGEFRSRVIELRYRQPHQLGWMEQVAFEAPRVAGDDRRAEMFWQVVTPTNLLALEAPEASVEAYTCRWSEGDWRAEGDLSTQELESWVGVAPRQRPTLGEHAL